MTQTTTGIHTNLKALAEISFKIEKKNIDSKCSFLSTIGFTNESAQQSMSRKKIRLKLIIIRLLVKKYLIERLAKKNQLFMDFLLLNFMLYAQYVGGELWEFMFFNQRRLTVSYDKQFQIPIFWLFISVDQKVSCENNNSFVNSV